MALPSTAEAWDGEWTLDRTGTRGAEAWRYARGLGFWHHPTGTLEEWQLEKTASLLVRRRRWVRSFLLRDDEGGSSCHPSCIDVGGSSPLWDVDVATRPSAGSPSTDLSAEGNGSSPAFAEVAALPEAPLTRVPAMEPWVCSVAPSSVLLHRGAAVRGVV